MVAFPSVFAEPTLALHLLRPFADVLVSRKLIPEWLSSSHLTGHPEQRIPLSTAFSMLDNVVAISGDPDLGLHAALRGSLDAEPLEYAAASACDVREALETIARYIAVINEGFEVEVRVEGALAVVEFHDRVPMPRAAIDFSIASLHLGRHLQWEGEERASATQICFRFPEPPDVRAYVRVFGASRLLFDAPLHGLRFPAEWLEAPMVRADEKLHKLLLRSVEGQLAELPSRRALSQRVRQMLREDPDRSWGGAKIIADRLHMSPRTLARCLEEEGTTFKALLDETRCGLALRYLLADRLSATEISERLGFSEPASFYRAFRRWFGRTPSEYIHRLGSPARSGQTRLDPNDHSEDPQVSP